MSDGALDNGRDGALGALHGELYFAIDGQLIKHLMLHLI